MDPNTTSGTTPPGTTRRTTTASLAGFLVLLVLVFAGARAAGARLGPVTTSHSQVQYTGHGAGMTGMSGMNMGQP